MKTPSLWNALPSPASGLEEPGPGGLEGLWVTKCCPGRARSFLCSLQLPLRCVGLLLDFLNGMCNWRLGGAWNIREAALGV